MTGSESARAEVLGVAVDAVDYEALCERIERAVRSGARETYLHANVHGINVAGNDPTMRRAYDEADLVWCDGAGVALGIRVLGGPMPQRMHFADTLWDLSTWCDERGHSMFLLGDRPGVADDAARLLRAHAPGLQVAGTHHGYFDKTAGSGENEAVIAAVNAARPDLLLVGFGMPLQERWLLENRHRLDVHVAFAVGALFTFISGGVPRGPKWMTDNGLEWLVRLAVEPRRLARRYLVGNPLFVGRVLRQRFTGWQPQPGGE